jgi:hypothetical protein
MADPTAELWRFFCVAGKRYFESIAADWQMPGCDWEKVSPTPFLHPIQRLLYPD